jgi:hypothetical protein
MTNENYNKRLNKDISLHQRLLNKELSYSKDLQKTESIERHTANIKTLEGMFK